MRVKRNLIILLISVIFLSGALFFLNKKNEQGEIVDEPPLNSSVVVFKADVDALDKIELKNESCHMKVSKENGEWKLDADPNASLKSNAITSLSAILSDVRAMDEIGEVEDEKLSEYGLSSPVAVASYSLNDGTKKELSIGASLFNGNKYYYKMADSNNVYTMDSYDAGILMSGIIAFRDGTIVSESIENIELVEIQKGKKVMSLKAKPPAKEGEIHFSAWSVIKPNMADTDDEALSKLILNQISNISANNFIDGVKDYSAYGLVSSASSVTVKTKEGTIKFHIGNPDGAGNYYVRVDGSPAVYCVAENLLSFLNVSAFDIMDKHVALFHIDDLKEIKIADGENTSILKINREGENGETASINGIEIPIDSFKSYYQTLLKLSYSEVTDSAYKGNAKVSIKFILNDGEEFLAEFYEYDSANYQVKTKTTTNVLIQKKYVDKALSELEKLK